MAGKPAKLFVGRIIDADETYLNGVKVGNITYQYPPRRYDVPAGLLKEGKNLLVVRVSNTVGKGGFVPDKRYELTDGVTHIDIRGDWQYKVGQVFPAAETRRWRRRRLFRPKTSPPAYTIRWLRRRSVMASKDFYGIRGKPIPAVRSEYRRLLPVLIADWRARWAGGQYPFPIRTAAQLYGGTIFAFREPMGGVAASAAGCFVGAEYRNGSDDRCGGMERYPSAGQEGCRGPACPGGGEDSLMATHRLLLRARSFSPQGSTEIRSS